MTAVPYSSLTGSLNSKLRRWCFCYLVCDELMRVIAKVIVSFLGSWWEVRVLLRLRTSLSFLRRTVRKEEKDSRGSACHFVLHSLLFFFFSRVYLFFSFVFTTWAAAPTGRSISQWVEINHFVIFRVFVGGAVFPIWTWPSRSTSFLSFGLTSHRIED